METLLYKSLKKYYTILHNYGYLNYNEVDKLLVLKYIINIIEKKHYYIKTEEEEKDIIIALYWLTNIKCLDLPEYTICN